MVNKGPVTSNSGIPMSLTMDLPIPNPARPCARTRRTPRRARGCRRSSGRICSGVWLSGARPGGRLSVKAWGLNPEKIDEKWWKCEISPSKLETKGWRMVISPSYMMTFQSSSSWSSSSSSSSSSSPSSSSSSKSKSSSSKSKSSSKSRSRSNN